MFKRRVLSISGTIGFCVIGALCISGCAAALIGAGAASGFMLSNDAAIGEFEVSYSDAWDVCIAQLESEGIEIYESDESKGLIKGMLNKTRYVAKIDSIDRGIQRVKVTARQYLLPKPHIAQGLFLKIAKDLE